MSKNILVVDDEKDVRDFLGDLLKDQGYSVRIAADGVEALEQIEQYKPALVFLDIQMPVLDGMSVASNLEYDNQMMKLPNVVI